MELFNVSATANTHKWNNFFENRFNSCYNNASSIPSGTFLNFCTNELKEITCWSPSPSYFFKKELFLEKIAPIGKIWRFIC